MLLSLIKTLKKVIKHFVILSLILFNYTSLAVQDYKVVKSTIKPVKFFVNRAIETKSILEQLALYKVVSLIGVTSIGKTELARRYALLNTNKYDLIWFFDSSLDLKEQFVYLAKNINQTFLNHTNKLSEEQDKAQDDVMKFLAQKEKWLLVFDNLRLGQNYKLIEIINWNHNGHIIVCSQDSKDLPNNIYVHKLDSENVTILLKKILGQELSNKKLIEKLVEIFKGYPGPIVQGAFLLKENNYLSVEEYKNILIKSSDPIKSHMELVLNLLNDNNKKLLLYISLLNNQNFSKNLLKILFKDLGDIGESIYNLNRFGLIKNIENFNDTHLFEMHDAARDAVLKFYTESQIQEAISYIINKFNSLMPKGVTSRYAFITSDITIKSSLEVLLDNAEKYKIDVYKILEFRKNLINYYLLSLDYYNVEKMKNWLEEKEKNNILSLNGMNDNNKIDYSWYLVDVGMYEDFAKANYSSALSYFVKAENVVQGIDNQPPELVTTILLQTAQTEVFGGDIYNAEQNIAKIDKIRHSFPDADYDMGLYWFIKAKMYLAKGQYENALIAIDNNIKAEAHLPQDTFTAPTYILKSEILNYMLRYKESYKIISRIEKQEIASNHIEHEIQGRILTQLSRAELGLGMTKSSLEHAIKACNIYIQEIQKYHILSIINIDYAAALVAKADALFSEKQYQKALEVYNEGEAIYLRRYGENYKNMDDISYLLSQGAKAACQIKNKFWKKHYYNQLITIFGEENTRSVDTIKFCARFTF